MNMHDEQFERTRRLLGGEAMERLAGARVAVFGIGGVGGYVCEALARSGVGALDLIDSDTVSLSNLNRQIIALHSTIGRYKTEVMRDRIRDINPDCAVRVYNCFFLPENASDFPFADYDYAVDAVDTVAAKVALVLHAQEAGVPIISSMGAGNKLDPSLFRVADIYKTNVCPLAKVMRHELRKRGVRHLKVVYSEETPLTPIEEPEAAADTAAGADQAAITPDGRAVANAYAEHFRRPVSGRPVPGSTAFVPSAAGLLIASEVVRDLAQGPKRS